MPREREALEALPGVGRKTANVVLNIAFGEPTLAVDTHVFRVAHRLDLAAGKTPLEVELGLLKVIPETYLHHAHHWLILHGRYVCQARKPRAMPVSFAICALRPTSGSIAARRKVAAAAKGCSHDGRQRPTVPDHPGPTNVPDAVLAAMQRPAIDIYSGEMVGITDSCLADLQDALPHQRAAPTSTPPTATAAGRRRSPTCSRAATPCWCWRAAASRSAGARWPR